MTLPNPIAASQVDAKSPIDEALMQAIKADLEYLDAAQQAAGAFDYQFKVNGDLGALRSGFLGTGSFIKRLRVDGGLISKATTFQACRAVLEYAGTQGTLDVDVRRYTKPDAAITSIRSLFTDAITSIGRVGSSLNTQSIARVTPQIATQSVARWKSTLNIASIVTHSVDESGNKVMRLNLTGGTVDLDWYPSAQVAFATGQVTVASATSGANNGTFTVYAVLDDGANAILITNNNGVEQNSPAGTCDLEAWKYTFTNPVSSEFTAGEYCLAASHTAGGNDGLLLIYAINQGGNNIITYGTGHVAQGGAAGNINVQRFIYTMAAPVSATNYVVGEYALMAGHTSGLNNGTFTITGVNSGGNGVSIYNQLGVVQGGAAGTVDTTRWIYAFATDPSADVAVNDYIIFAGTTSGLNSGTFQVKAVNQSAGTNVVVASYFGTTQGGAAGTAYTAKKKVSFATDQSAYITTDSRIHLANTYALPVDDYDVLEVNRGGGANYNAIIRCNGTTEQYGAQGLVSLESKSIFNTRPSIAVQPYYNNFHNTGGRISTNAVLNATRKIIPADTLVMADIYDVPKNAKNLVIQLL